MLLPEDQEKLLRYYYNKLGDSLRNLDLDKKILIASMKELNPGSDHNENICEELEIMKSPSYSEVQAAQLDLEERGLLSIGDSMTGHKRGSAGGVEYKMKYVSLTTQGRDLARKYSRWFTRCGLWGQEHKGNPVLLILIWILSLIVTYAMAS